MGSNVVNDSSVDRSITLVLTGLGVGAFILLTVLGMGNVQKQAENATDTDGVVATPVQPVEIGE